MAKLKRSHPVAVGPIRLPTALPWFVPASVSNDSWQRGDWTGIRGQYLGHDRPVVKGELHTMRVSNTTLALESYHAKLAAKQEDSGRRIGFACSRLVLEVQGNNVPRLYRGRRG